MNPDGLPRGTRTVLVVQEWESIRHLYRRVLEGLGYRVVEAGSPEEARSAAGGISGGPDLAILEVALPRTSGFELASELERFSGDLRILFTSVYSWKGESTGRRFLEKPFSVEQFARKVREVLEEGRGVPLS